MTAPRGPQPFSGQEKRLRLLAFVRQDSVVRVDKRVEDTAMTWPHLLVIEFIAAMIWSLGLFVISALFNAPLQDHSNVDCTPNPSKAPWYLLSLQELLLHMDKGLAGVVVPTLWLVFMAAIPYIDRSREGIGLWFTNEVVLRAAEGWPERVFRGKDAVRSFYEGFAEIVGRDSVIEDLIDAGDVVVTRMRAHMTGAQSGLEGEMRFTQVTTFRKGKVVLAEFFWDHQEALEAAGLSE